MFSPQKRQSNYFPGLTFEHDTERNYMFSHATRPNWISHRPIIDGIAGLISSCMTIMGKYLMSYSVNRSVFLIVNSSRHNI